MKAQIVMIDPPWLSPAASLREGDTINLTNIIEYFLGVSTGLPDFTIYELNIYMDPRNKTYALQSAIKYDAGANSKLSSPWDALNSVSLGDIELIINFSKKTFEVDCDLTLTELSDSIKSVGEVFKSDAVLDITDIPIPLCNYPDKPVLSAQDAESSYKSGDELTFEEITDWNYRYDLEYRTAAQDRLTLQFGFNLSASFEFDQPDIISQSNGENWQKLFESLAQFKTIYPALQKDLLLLQTDPGGETAKNAIATFATIVQDVSSAFEAIDSANLASQSGTDQAQASIYRYRLETDIESETPTITLQNLDTDWQVIPLDLNLLPDIALNNQKCDSPQTNNDMATYTYPAEDAVANPVSLIFGFDGLKIMSLQNAWSCISSARNKNLINSGQETNPNFVDSIKTEIDALAADMGLSLDKTRYVFDVSIFSTLDQNSEQPILEFRNLYFDL